MNVEEGSLSNLLLDLARVQDVISKLTPASERLVVLAEISNASDERSQFFLDLCDLYDGVIPPGLHRSRDGITTNLCASVDELLDQLACVDVRKRLWPAKARLVFEQIRNLAPIETRRLQVAATGSEGVSLLSDPAAGQSTNLGTDWNCQLAA